MSMPTLPLAFVGWFFAIVSFAAPAIGVLLVALPLIALCGVSIFTLRSDQVRAQIEHPQPR